MRTESQGADFVEFDSRADAWGSLPSRRAAAGKPLRMRLERFNPALSLYQRLGFRELADRGAYLFMEWRAAP